MIRQKSNTDPAEIKHIDEKTGGKMKMRTDIRLHNITAVIASLFAVMVFVMPIAAQDSCEVPGSVYITDGGKLGIGTIYPDPYAALHILRSNGHAQLMIEETNGTPDLRTLLRMVNNGSIATRFETSGAVWREQFQDNAYTLTKNGTGGNELTIIASTGDMTVRGNLFTKGPACEDGCDAVFDPDFTVETIEEHSDAMWAAGYLPAVGSTKPHQPTNITEKLGGVLNELEKAHIYIDQLNDELNSKSEQVADLEARLARLESLLEVK